MTYSLQRGAFTLLFQAPDLTTAQAMGQATADLIRTKIDLYSTAAGTGVTIQTFTPANTPVVAGIVFEEAT